MAVVVAHLAVPPQRARPHVARLPGRTADKPPQCLVGSFRIWPTPFALRDDFVRSSQPEGVLGPHLGRVLDVVAAWGWSLIFGGAPRRQTSLSNGSTIREQLPASERVGSVILVWCAQPAEEPGSGAFPGQPVGRCSDSRRAEARSGLVCERVCGGLWRWWLWPGWCGQGARGAGEVDRHHSEYEPGRVSGELVRGCYLVGCVSSDQAVCWSVDLDGEYEQGGRARAASLR